MQRVFFVELILLNAGLLSKTVCVVTGKHFVLAFKQFYKKLQDGYGSYMYTGITNCLAKAVQYRYIFVERWI
ncbi:MAG: hypothetical protein IPO01_12715 [Chitinophagaceae bacterium]|nr:hypothetical protein [Chitinophagaceae bacterium]